MEENKVIIENPEPQYIEFAVFEGTTYKTLNTRKNQLRKPYKVDNPKLISSFIPGTIVHIYVKEGAKIKKGEKLLSLQAMKMNNNIVSTIDGKVKKIYVKTGIRVSKSELLVELA